MSNKNEEIFLFEKLTFLKALEDGIPHKYDCDPDCCNPNSDCNPNSGCFPVDSGCHPNCDPTCSGPNNSFKENIRIRRNRP